MLLSKEERAEIRERNDKATEGPWRNDKGHIRPIQGGGIILRTHQMITWAGMDGYQPRQALQDAEFVAYARTDVTKLLDHIEQLENGE